MTVLLLEDNVMFTMPVVEAAGALGHTVIPVASPEEAMARLSPGALDAVLMDMRLVTRELVGAIPSSTAVAAFGPHVEGQLFMELRQLGVKDVWPNSKLREKLPRWLERVAAD